MGQLQNKEVSPLKTWNGIQWALSDVAYGAKVIIETALKRLERLDSLNCLIDNSKKLKALNIIICKKVDYDFLDDEWAEENYEYALENYNLNHDIELTRKEYNLLKECFK